MKNTNCRLTSLQVLLTVLLCVASANGRASAGARPLLTMRLRANDTDTTEQGLPVERRGSDAFVTIPSVAAWNGGYLSAE